MTHRNHGDVVAEGLAQQRNRLLRLCGSAPVERFQRDAFISLKHKYFFCQTPKAACSTIKLTLIRAELEDIYFDVAENRSLHVDGLSPLLKPMMVPAIDLRLRRLFKFCFVRDPAVRLVSAYLDKIVRNKPQKYQILKRLGQERNPHYHVSFEAFVDVICSQAPQSLDPHWSVQVNQVFADRIAYDFVGRVEAFEADLRIVLGEIGIDTSFIAPAISHRTDANTVSANLLTKPLRQKIADYYHQDYERFGYDAERADRSS